MQFFMLDVSSPWGEGETPGCVVRPESVRSVYYRRNGRSTGETDEFVGVWPKRPVTRQRQHDGARYAF